MISRQAFLEYSRTVARILDGAQSAVSANVAAWVEMNPAASVEAAREAAIGILDGAVQSFGDAAAAFAARWYDALAEASHVKLPEAITETVYSADDVERHVRWAVSLYGNGAPSAFASNLGDWARQRCARSLNETIIANAKRDRASGVRYARVPTGSETCAFCFMLASRGAKYDSRESAGELHSGLNRFHLHCDCKVVPGFEDDPDAELVEGWRPKEARERLSLMERQCGAKAGSDWKQNETLTRYMRLHNSEWLYTGEPVKTDYSRNPLEKYGKLRVANDYSRENFTSKGEEWGDLWAHHVLELNGLRVETMGMDDIDLLINGETWEVKSPSMKASGIDNPEYLGFVESNLRKAVRQFEKRDMSATRVVFNSKYRAAPDELIEIELKKRMEMHDVLEVLFVQKDGSLKMLRRDIK